MNKREKIIYKNYYHIQGMIATDNSRWSKLLHSIAAKAHTVSWWREYTEKKAANTMSSTSRIEQQVGSCLIVQEKGERRITFASMGSYHMKSIARCYTVPTENKYLSYPVNNNPPSSPSSGYYSNPPHTPRLSL